MVDVKKLTVGFLILATLSASLAFAFSGFFASQATTPQDAANIGQVPNKNPPSSAFSESLPDNSSKNTALSNKITEAALPPVTSSTNLTQVFANQYVRQVVKLNPSGPATDQNGNPSIT